MPFPIDPIYVEQAEIESGSKFPAIYRAAMISRNGGIIESEDDSWQLFPVFDKSQKED